MTTLYYSHPDFLRHITGEDHPESPERVQVIATALAAPEFATVQRLRPPLSAAQEQQVLLVHTSAYLEQLQQRSALGTMQALDPDTSLSPGSLTAALRAVGAVCAAVDQLLTGRATNAFCAVRPPGHHAEADSAKGFCLFNNIAIAAQYARHRYALRRIAIVDFDVHHGNGTQACFYQQPEVLYISSHEMPNFPGTGYPHEVGVGNIINIPLPYKTNSAMFRDYYNRSVFPALAVFEPELILLSAGFDAHEDDPLSSVQLTTEDYRWLTAEINRLAQRYCQGRVISVLEGGYALPALARSVAVHVAQLLNAATL